MSQTSESLDVVNPEQEVLIAWINATYYQRSGGELAA